MARSSTAGCKWCAAAAVSNDAENTESSSSDDGFRDGVRGDGYGQFARPFRFADQERHAQLQPATGGVDGGNRERGAYRGAVLHVDRWVGGGDAESSEYTCSRNQLWIGVGAGGGLLPGICVVWAGGRGYASLAGTGGAAYRHRHDDVATTSIWCASECYRDDCLCRDHFRRRAGA